MINSFELRLTLVATLVSGLALGVFGFTFWNFNGDYHKKRLDRELADIVAQAAEFGFPISPAGPSFRDGGDPGIAPEAMVESEDYAIFFGEEFEEIAFATTWETVSEVLGSTGWPGYLTRSELPRLAPPASSEGPGGFLDFQDGGADFDGPGEAPWWSGPEFVTIRGDAESWRVASIRVGDETTHAALNLRVFNDRLFGIAFELFTAGVVALLACALGSWLVARHALRPVRALTEAAGRTTAADLGSRIAASGTTEFQRLSRVFNDMLGRLDRSFEQAARFSADASHELKTPLTIMQGEIEAALKSAPPDSAEQRVYSSQLDELQRLKALVQKLLLLAQADSGSLKLQREPISLSEAIRSTFEDLEAVDPAMGVELDIRVEAQVCGDIGLLRQVIHNLVANATVHNTTGGHVRGSLRTREGLAVFRIENSGPGIPEAEHAHIFDRFYRADESRAREGVGLGLSLSREIARCHDGELRLLGSEPGRTVFELTLPLDGR